MEETVKQRLMMFKDYLGIGQAKFEKLAGLSNGYLNQLRNAPGAVKLQSIIYAFPELNKNWLLTGEGEMLLPSQSNREAIAIESGDDKIDMPVLGKDYRMVPIIHVDSVGGMHSTNDIIGEPEYIEGYIPFAGAWEDDRVIHESGGSMAPTIPAGSLMLIRKVESWREYLGYGNIFVLVLADGRRITKEVTRHDDNPRDYVLCVSHSDDVPDEELPKSFIVQVWKVVKWVTNIGW